MHDMPDLFLYLNNTEWTAISAMASAISVMAVSAFSYFTLNAALRATRAAESQARTAEALTSRPFVAIHSKYDKEMEATRVSAENQGNGPALDVVAKLEYENPVESAEYTIGCLAVGEDFKFLIGTESNRLKAVTLRYESLTDRGWETKVILFGGHPFKTSVSELKAYAHDGPPMSI